MPVTVTQLKTALKIDYSTDDADLLRLRDAAVDFITEYTGISILPEKHTQYIPYWMKTRFESFPFIGIESVKYYDSTNTLVTMPATDYFLIRSNPPSVYVNFREFPSIYEDTEIEINYTTGYGDLPNHLQQAVIAIVGAWYNNPEATAPISLSTVPMSAQFILDNMKVKGVLE
jgi:uncharacterized phiE125 gp8 family phage protein